MSKLILTHEVTGLGSPGDVVEVKNGRVFLRRYIYVEYVVCGNYTLHIFLHLFFYCY